MTTGHPVAWVPGLVTPQHLQQLDRYHSGALRSRLSAIEPLGWGVHKLRLDPRALASGQVALSEFSGVLPDGTPLGLPPGDPGLPPARPVGDAFPPTSPSLLVYLTLPRERLNGTANYGASSEGRQRYVLSHETLTDLAGVEEPAEVPLARPNLSLVFETEPREGVEAMPIARIVRQEDGELAQHPVYVPPCTRIDAAGFIESGLARLLRLMSQRQRELAASCRQVDGRSVEFGAGDVSKFLLLSTINARLPILSFYARSGETHPRALYLTLVELAGALATFSVDFDPLSLPPFNYVDLQDTFEVLFARLTTLLRTSIAHRCIEWPLLGRTDGVHQVELSESVLTCQAFFLSVRSNVSEQDVVTQLPRISKVASFRDMERVVSSSTPGAPLSITLRPPSEIPVKAGELYFSIDTENAFWRNVLSERKLAVYLPQPFLAEKTKVQLLGIPGASPN